MSKYVSPKIEILNIHTADVITLSLLFQIGKLEGIDDEESKTAIYNAEQWIAP
jgi:hypothetical protein